jgi:hypothetical protein
MGANVVQQRSLGPPTNPNEGWLVACTHELIIGIMKECKILAEAIGLVAKKGELKCLHDPLLLTVNPSGQSFAHCALAVMCERGGRDVGGEEDLFAMHDL